MAAALAYAFEPAEDLRAEAIATPLRIWIDRRVRDELLAFLGTGALAGMIVRNGRIEIGKWAINVTLADADAILALPGVWECAYIAAGHIETALRLRRSSLIPSPAVAAALLGMQDHSRRWNEARREALAAGGRFEHPVRDTRLDLAEAAIGGGR